MDQVMGTKFRNAYRAAEAANYEFLLDYLARSIGWENLPTLRDTHAALNCVVCGEPDGLVPPVLCDGPWCNRRAARCAPRAAGGREKAPGAPGAGARGREAARPLQAVPPGVPGGSGPGWGPMAVPPVRATGRWRGCRPAPAAAAS